MKGLIFSVAMLAMVLATSEAEAQVCRNGVCQRAAVDQPVRNVVRGVVVTAANVVRGPSVMSGAIVNRSQVAYDHAVQEATILAGQQRVYHPLGVAPGCRYSGTGSSFSVDRPNHCYMRLGNRRLVARAAVQGSDGRWYWSAHYR